MLLEAIVSESTFNDVVSSLTSRQIVAIERKPHIVTGFPQLHLMADAPVGEVLRLAARHRAAICGNEDYLPEMDRLKLTARSEVGEYVWDGEIGSIYFWTNGREEERF